MCTHELRDSHGWCRSGMGARATDDGEDEEPEILHLEIISTEFIGGAVEGEVFPGWSSAFRLVLLDYAG